MTDNRRLVVARRSRYKRVLNNYWMPAPDRVLLLIAGVDKRRNYAVASPHWVRRETAPSESVIKDAEGLSRRCIDLAAQPSAEPTPAATAPRPQHKLGRNEPCRVRQREEVQEVSWSAPACRDRQQPDIGDSQHQQ